MKPHLFIGSSSEKRVYAYALQSQLESNAEVTVWNQGFFQLNTSYMDSLISGLNNFDFGVFVFTPDDILKFRDETLRSVRDNVLFEFGLFMGKLGKERVFFVMPSVTDKLRLPSDLLGLSTLTYDPGRDNIEAALGPACSKIMQAVDRFGVRQERLGSPEIETIKNPNVLCTCSSQYFLLSFMKDVELIRNETEKLSAQISELHSADSTKLIDALMDKHFDIIHISAYVNPETGDIYFNEVNSEAICRAERSTSAMGRAVAHGDGVDSISAVSFSRLVELAKARLVILATCDSLILAAKLARVTNMVAATGLVSVDDILRWELGLYRCLSKGVSLSKSFETANSLSNAPMILLLKKDIAFTG